MTHVPVWLYALSVVNAVGTVAMVSLLVMLLRARRRQREMETESPGYARQSVDLAFGPASGETLHSAPCPFSDTCDRVNCRLEKQGMTSMLAAEGGFGDPVCAKCGEPARLIESKVVAVPAEWRDVVRLADAVACDRCGFVSEGKVPYISLDQRLRDDPELLKAAVGVAARELAKRVVECDTLDRMSNPHQRTG